MPHHAAHTVDDFLRGKSSHTQELFRHFVIAFGKVGEVQVVPAKTMIGIATPRKRIAYVTHLGKNFIHVVFAFDRAYEDNLCFQKIVQVPGEMKQFNHHFRMYEKDDLNDEVLHFMKLAYSLGR
ncbi:MAG TPA: DUF5655 domain-containing protein [Chryseosolibacter sp.]